MTDDARIVPPTEPETAFPFRIRVDARVPDGTIIAYRPVVGRVGRRTFETLPPSVMLTLQRMQDDD